MKKTLIQIYTGDGKGKSTALFGLAIRALGRGKRVLIMQFLKARETGELLFLKDKTEDLHIERANTSKKFSWNMTEEEKLLARKEVLNAMDKVITMQDEYDLILCDELINCIKSGSISEDELLEFMDKKSDKVELVLTGRNASERLINKAQLVTEMKKVKHPYDIGIDAREAIEY